jgi:Beta-propeller repeat
MRRTICLCCLCALMLTTPASAEIRAEAASGRRPLAFEENRGQVDSAVRFLARAPGYTLFLTSSEAVLAPRDGAAPVRLRWAGASGPPALAAEGELPGHTSYLVGNDPARWRTRIPSFARIRYREAFPGVDLVFYGSPQQLEADFVLSPGTDPRGIRLEIEGADGLEIDPDGDLVLSLGGGEVRLGRPVSYQEAGSARRQVESGWQILGGDGAVRRVGFRLGEHDAARPVVIDPVLSYSTFLGGSDFDVAGGVAVDDAGVVYVYGQTESVDFPGSGVPPQPAPRPSFFDIFLIRLDPAGEILGTTFFGGSHHEGTYGLAIDPQGRVYLAGQTESADLPRVNPLPVPWKGCCQAFIAKLDPASDSLVYSTYLDSQGAIGIAADAEGNAFVAGLTSSPSFPVVNAFQPNLKGSVDGFVMKLGPDGRDLLYSSFLGGSGADYVLGIAVDAAGWMWVTGYTDSLDFPTGRALRTSYGGGLYDAFVARLGPEGELGFSTYLGGSGSDMAMAVAVDRAGNGYVTGGTGSSDFPTTRNAFQRSRRGSDDAFVTRLDPTGALAYSTYLGGRSWDGGRAVEADASGSAWVVGATASPDFPLKDPVRAQCGPVRRSSCAASDAFVTRLDPTGSRLLGSTYLGGSLSPPSSPPSPDLALDQAQDIALDAAGDAYVTGYTWAPDFPTTEGALQPAFGGVVDSYLTRLSPSSNRPPECAAAAASPGTLWPPNGQLVPVSIRGVTDPDGDPVTLAVTSVRQDEPLSKKGSPDASGVGAPTARLRADRRGGGDGRVYHLGFTATDGRGGSCSGAVTVCVPHDPRPGAACGDGGSLFDSTAPGI